MTDKELQTLAQRFAEETNNDLNHKDFAEAFGIKFLRWLSERFCIVSKENIEQICDEIEFYANDGDADYVSYATIKALNRIFGKETSNQDNP